MHYIWLFLLFPISDLPCPEPMAPFTTDTGKFTVFTVLTCGLWPWSCVQFKVINSLSPASLSVRPSVCHDLPHSLFEHHFYPSGWSDWGLNSYESQDIESWPRQGHVSIAPKTRLWRVAKVDPQKKWSSWAWRIENTRFNHITYNCWNWCRMQSFCASCTEVK